MALARVGSPDDTDPANTILQEHLGMVYQNWLVEVSGHTVDAFGLHLRCRFFRVLHSLAASLASITRMVDSFVGLFCADYGAHAS